MYSSMVYCYVSCSSAFTLNSTNIFVYLFICKRVDAPDKNMDYAYRVNVIMINLFSYPQHINVRMHSPVPQ